MPRLIDIRLVKDRDDEWRANGARLDAVSGCVECPFAVWETGWAWCQERVGNAPLPVGAHGEMTGPVPADCPLRSSPVVVVLKEE